MRRKKQKALHQKNKKLALQKERAVWCDTKTKSAASQKQKACTAKRKSGAMWHKQKVFPQWRPVTVSHCEGRIVFYCIRFLLSNGPIAAKAGPKYVRREWQLRALDSVCPKQSLDLQLHKQAWTYATLPCQVSQEKEGNLKAHRGNGRQYRGRKKEQCDTKNRAPRCKKK